MSPAENQMLEFCEKLYEELGELLGYGESETDDDDEENA